MISDQNSKQHLVEIKHLKKQVADLKRDNEKFKLIAENTSDNIAITTFDLQAKYIYISPSSTGNMGYEQAEIIGHSFFDFIHPADKKFIIKLIKSYLKQFIEKTLRASNKNIKETVEFRFRHKNGEWRNMRSTVNLAGSYMLAISRDITELKKTNDAILKSEKKYRTLVESINIGLAHVDQDENIYFVNQIAADIFEYSQAELIGMNLSAITSQGSFNKILAQSAQRKTGKMGSYEMNIETKSGLTKTINVGATPQFHQDGTYLGSNGIIQDITQRKLAESKLKESEKNYRTLIGNIEEGIAHIDLNENFIYANQAAAHIFECHKDELVGKNLQEFTTSKIFSKTQKQKISNHYIMEIKTHLQKVKTLKVSTNPIISEQGVLLGSFGVFHDISEFTQAQKALRDSEAKFRQIYENMTVGIARVNLDFTIESANKAYCQMLGYTETELIGKQLKDITHVESEAENIMLQEQLQESNQDHYRLEKKFRHKNGKTVIGILDANLIRSADGNPSFFLGSVLDITARKKADQEVRRLSQVVIQSPSIIVITDLKGNIEYANPSFSKITHYTIEEVLHKNPRFLKSKMIPDEIYDNLWDTITAGKEWQGELLNKTKEGDLYWESAYIFPAFDNNGKKTNYIKLSEDITKRKQAEQKIKENEEKFQSLLANSEAGYFYIDSKGIFRDVNNAWLRMYKFNAKEEVIGKHFAKVQKVEDLQAADRLVQGIMKNDPLYLTGEFSRKCKDNSIGSHHFSSCPVYRDGEVIGIEGLIIDSTKQKKAEKEIISSRDRLKVLNKIIRHDLANDFSVIKSAVNLYQKTSNAAMLDEINNRVIRSLSTIDNYKKYESFIDSKHELYKMDISAVIRKTIAEFPKIEFKLKGESCIFADDAISSVFKNLISNSIKHGNATKIEIKIKNIGSLCEVVFKDNGIGIISKIKDHIFNEGFFYGKAGHTGIGLHIVYKTIEHYGGTITLDQSFKDGAKFTISFRRVI